MIEQARRPVRALPDIRQGTAALPGSEAKLHVMAERARLRLPIFHPGDAQLDCAAGKNRPEVQKRMDSCATGIRWVTLEKDRGRWRVRVRVRPGPCGRKSLGFYASREEALEALRAWRQG